MDLNNSEKWSFIFGELFRGKIVGDGKYFIPIPEIRVNCVSPILQVKLDSSQAKSHWQLGAWANLFCQVNQTYSLIGEQRKPCKINGNTLLQFGQPTSQIPYNLQLLFPYWIEEVSVEVWEYLNPSGLYPTDFLGLTRMVQGVDYVLKNPEYGGTQDLQISRFTINTEFAQYEVGRFRSLVDGEILSDPLLDIRPFQLIAIFTSSKQIGSGEISVNIRPKV